MIVWIDYPETGDSYIFNNIRRVESDHVFYYLWHGADLSPDIYVRTKKSKIRVEEEEHIDLDNTEYLGDDEDD